MHRTRRDPSGPERSSRYVQAGWTYGLLGLVVMGLTVLTPELANPERRGDWIALLVGLPIFLLFACAIAYGHRAAAVLFRLLGMDAARASRYGAGCRQVLTMVLTVSAFARTLIFSANAAGWRPRLAGLDVMPVSPSPRMWLNALLMTIICAMLFRAAWLPLLKRWRDPDPGH